MYAADGVGAGKVGDGPSYAQHAMIAAGAHPHRRGEAVSSRTKAALTAARERGVKLGNPNGAKALRRAGKGNAAAVSVLKDAATRHAADLAPVIAHLRSEGLASLPALASALNERQIRTPRGGKWHPSSVRNLLERLPRG